LILGDPGHKPDMTLAAGLADPADRLEGRDRPVHAPAMIGLKRLRNLRHCMEAVVQDQVPGNVIEAGSTM